MWFWHTNQYVCIGQAIYVGLDQSPPAPHAHRQGITPRFGAVGQHGSIAIIERFILTLNKGCTHIILLPLCTDAFHHELTCFANWYNQSRPHSALNRQPLWRTHSP